MFYLQKKKRKARQQWIQERPRDEETDKRKSVENSCKIDFMEQTEETTDRRNPELREGF